jgi:hypothetical protein
VRCDCALHEVREFAGHADIRWRFLKDNPPPFIARVSASGVTRVYPAKLDP